MRFILGGGHHDAGLHPNKAHAAWGGRARRLEPEAPAGRDDGVSRGLDTLPDQLDIGDSCWLLALTIIDRSRPVWHPRRRHPSAGSEMIPMVRKRFLSLRKAPWCASTVAAVVLAALAGTSGTAGLALATSVASSARPCDIYAGGGTPCVAAYSTVRALYRNYRGPLYQVTRASDGAIADIGALETGGYADAAAQNSFCAGTVCTITRIYDQSSYHNDLGVGPLVRVPCCAPAGAEPGFRLVPCANAREGRWPIEIRCPRTASAVGWRTA